MGTATYFSPEQAQGLGVDARSDIYSLGVVLYEMVCGKPPFSGQQPGRGRHQARQRRCRRARAPSTRTCRRRSSRSSSRAWPRIPTTATRPADDLRADLVRFRQGRAVAAQPFDDVRRRRTRPWRCRAPGPPAPAARIQEAHHGAARRWRRRCRPRCVAARASTSCCCSRCWRRSAGLLFLLAKEVGIIGEGTTAKVAVINVVGDDAATATQKLEADRPQGERGRGEQRGRPRDRLRPGPASRQPMSTRTPRSRSRCRKGLEKVKVPNVVGKAEATARSQLEDLGFSVSLSSSSPTTTSPKGSRRQAEPRRRTARSTEVRRSPSPCRRASRARRAQRGRQEPKTTPPTRSTTPRQFKVKRTHASTRRRSTRATSSAAIRRAGSDAAKGVDGHDRHLRRPETRSTCPTSSVRPKSAAKAELTSAGFKVNVVHQATSSLGDDGTVIDQNPNGGTIGRQGFDRHHHRRYDLVDGYVSRQRGRRATSASGRGRRW